MKVAIIFLLIGFSLATLSNYNNENLQLSCFLSFQTLIRYPALHEPLKLSLPLKDVYKLISVDREFVTVLQMVYYINTQCKYLFNLLSENKNAAEAVGRIKVFLSQISKDGDHIKERLNQAIETREPRDLEKYFNEKVASIHNKLVSISEFIAVAVVKRFSNSQVKSCRNAIGALDKTPTLKYPADKFIGISLDTYTICDPPK
eukprot:TRINITY_DN721_c0_g2_i1.p1 TRINITY_DN721_c0_g2~~TRINITY_DN721_c0_g2_i1.p1  ORF type:complete len:203 (+),score=20.04 TRINITY_DN721_c0_g2_i1:109-717(+)